MIHLIIRTWDPAKESWDDYIKEQRLALEFALTTAYSHIPSALRATKSAEQILKGCQREKRDH